jgi:hypothetical protein
MVSIPTGHERRQRAFDRGFVILGIVVAATFLWYIPDSEPAAIVAALAMAAAAMLPAWLWVRDGASDIPIFPVYGLTFLFTYALPLLGPQTYMDHASESKLIAGGVLGLGLLAGTATWYWFRRGTPRVKRTSLELPVARMRWLLFVAAVLNMIFYVGHTGQWWDWIPSEVLAVFRVFITSLYVLSVFVHFHNIGNRSLRGLHAGLFLVVFGLAELASSASLLLVGSMFQMLIALTGFALGRGSIPLKSALAAVFVFSVLHAGKGEMREKYWFGTLGYEPQPTEYLELYTEWFGYGLGTSAPSAGNSSETLSLRERAGLAYIFLLVMEMSPERTPYLFGESYAPIPRLLVPRFINPDRESTHEGTIILNVHYGLQTRETAMTATIAWDLIGEAQANFGIPGVVIMFTLLGWIYGVVERWSRGHRLFSFRTMVALVVLSMAVQVGITLAVYVTALFQAMVALVTLAVVAMERRSLANILAAVQGVRLEPAERGSR